MKNPKPKKLTPITALILILVLLTTMLPSNTISAETIYAGMPNGDTIIKNAAFTDIAGNANADNILRMGVYSVINEYGSTQYRPNDYALRQDVLANLVRAIGKQDAAVAAGEAMKLQNPALSTVDAYKMGHIEQAKTSGIITQAEIDAMAVLSKAELTAVDKEVAAAVKKNWKMTLSEKAALKKTLTDQKSYNKALKSAVTREELAVWTAKALGLEPVVSEKTMSTHTYKDWKSINSAKLPYVEAVQRSGILKGESANTYNPKGKIRRGELAAILSRTADASLAALELTTGYGKVVSKNVKNDLKSYTQIVTTDMRIENPESELINVTVVSTATNNRKDTQSIPVIKNGKIGNQNLIQQNDIVEYTLTKENKVLLMQVGRLKELKGKFLGYDKNTGMVQMADLNGKKYQFKLQPNTVTTAQKTPIEITRANSNLPATAIYEGSNLRALDLDVASDKINNQDMAVKILFADPLGNVLKVEDENYNMQYFELAEDAGIYINGELQGIEAIGFDQDAVLKVADNKVMEVRVFTDENTEEEPYTQVITGKVREVMGNNLFLSPDNAPDSQHSYILSSTVPIIKNKQNVSKYKLQPGDRVKITVDSTMGDYVSRVEIQGSGVKIDNLYKGDIKEVLPATNEIILSNVSTYGYYDWVKTGDYIKYKVSDDAALYNGNSLIELSKLKDNIGKTLYAVSKNNYGDEEIVHGLLKEGYEDFVYKKIDDIKYTANQLTLSDGRIMDYREGSIIIMDGKLMDAGDIRENTSSFVVQNRTTTGASTASIISIDSFNGLGGYHISKGYLNTMGEDYFTMETGYRVANNVWDSYNGFVYTLSNDTTILDNIIENKVITADKFAESRYKPYTYTWTNYLTSNGGKEFHEDNMYHNDYNKYRYSIYYHEHSLLYTVTDEYGNAIGINIFGKDKDQFKPNKVHTERFSSGKIKSIDSGNYMLTIEKGMEFSPVYQDWRPVTVPIPLDTTKAVVLKDGKHVSLDELTTEDHVYAVSVDRYAVLILAE